MPASGACTTEEKVKATINPVTATGAPAAIDGALQGEVTTGDVTVEPVEGDPKSVYLVSGDLAGVNEIRLYADADLGDGVRHLEDFVTLNVSGAEAVSLGLTLGTPEPKDASAPADTLRRRRK